MEDQKYIHMWVYIWCAPFDLPRAIRGFSINQLGELFFYARVVGGVVMIIEQCARIDNYKTRKKVSKI